MKIFLVGIKGSGMSSLAIMLKGVGHEVLGSDVEKEFFTDEKLIKNNIKFVDFSKTHITSDIDLVILGNAFADDVEQVVYAKELGIEVIRYYNYIDRFGEDKTNIAITGTNGKTTTTALMVEMFGSEKPNYLIGDGNGNGNIESNFFIFEACEYKRTFLNYNPKITVINNIEMDHPDYFKDVKDVIDAFVEVANKSRDIIVNIDDENIQILLEKINDNLNVHKFSLTNKNADVYLDNICEGKFGYEFDLYYKNQKYSNLKLPFYGEHMLYNSLAVILSGLVVGFEVEYIIKNMSNFHGANRRFEQYILSEEKNIVLIDDYAHHPTSIDLVIKAIRQKYPNHKLNLAFQPHTFSRTVEFLDEFSEVLNYADSVLIDPIFGSIREKESNVSVDILKDTFKNKYSNKLVNTIDELVTCEENQVICLVGAGDLDKRYIEPIKNKFKD